MSLTNQNEQLKRTENAKVFNTITSHAGNEVTALEWSNEGKKLFSGDTAGLVFQHSGNERG